MYRIYYPDGRIRKFEKFCEVVEQIVYFGAIGYSKGK